MQRYRTKSKAERKKRTRMMRWRTRNLLRRRTSGPSWRGPLVAVALLQVKAPRDKFFLFYLFCVLSAEKKKKKSKKAKAAAAAPAPASTAGEDGQDAHAHAAAPAAAAAGDEEVDDEVPAPAPVAKKSAADDIFGSIADEPEEDDPFKKKGVCCTFFFILLIFLSEGSFPNWWAFRYGRRGRRQRPLWCTQEAGGGGGGIQE